MQRIKALDPAVQTGETKALFDATKAKLGVIPNLVKTLGHSTAALKSYLSFSGALGESSVLGKQLGEQIALAVANANGCEYCNAAHSYLGQRVAGLSEADIKLARTGNATDLKAQAALAFSLALLKKKGKLSDADINLARNAGFDDAAIVEIIAHTVLNIFTNYFNNAAAVAVDFPKVELVAEASI
jgi:uncharacterized peroxidase-related enzyme